MPYTFTDHLPESILKLIWKNGIPLRLSNKNKQAIKRSHATLMHLLESGKTVYGINTGFGKLAHTKISPHLLKTLQEKIVLSHACGVGPLLDDNTVRLMMALKIFSLAQGYSGVSLTLIESLLRLYHAKAYPCIPSQGSVGASGDLAPLAHMSAALLGVGDIRYQNTIQPAKTVLKKLGLKPCVLGAKEGLALLNGTQASTAIALSGLFLTESIFSAALVSGCLSLEALMGSHAPFDKRIHAVRKQAGQIEVAAHYRKLLKGSRLHASHKNCDRVQDPYSLRCQPQVMGACLDQIRYAQALLINEANAVTDNPLLFSDTQESLSGGNFHAEPVAFASDALSIALTEIGNLSERRIALLVDPNSNYGLPAFLVEEAGLNSGFMIAQVTAAALASENKTLAHPASVDSIPTSANQEDHVSMATFAARKMVQIAENTANIIAIELLAATQGVELRKPHLTSGLLQEAIKTIRKAVPFYDTDRYFAPDIALCKNLILDGAF